MRKWSFIFYSVLAVFAAGCSEIIAPVEQPVAPDKVVENEVCPDVPIMFGYGGITKSDPLNIESLTGHFGLFVAVEGNADLTDKGKLPIKDNVALRYENGYGFRIGYSSEEKAWYYPETNEKYRFCACYQQPDSKRLDTVFVRNEANEIVSSKLYLPMTKSNDLSSPGPFLWAKAKSGDDDETHSFNGNVVKNGHVPYFTFTHPMAKVSFSISLADPLTKDMGNSWLQLDELALVNSPSKADFCLIDTQGQSEGCFENIEYPDVNREYWYVEGKDVSTQVKSDMNKMSFVKGPDGSSRNIFCRLNAGDHEQKSVGSVLILPRAAGDPLVCRMRFRYGTGNSVSGYQHYDVELNPSDFGYEGGYEAGVEYRYNIVVDYRSIPSSDGKYYGVNGPYVRGKWLNENQYSKKQEPTE